MHPHAFFFFFFFFEMAQNQYRQSHTTLIKLHLMCFLLWENTHYNAKTLEFHYMEVGAWSAEIIFNSFKAAQSLAFG